MTGVQTCALPISKAGYDFSKQGDLGKLIPEVTGEKMHGLSKTQSKMRLEGNEIPIPKTELGYTPTSSDMDQEKKQCFKFPLHNNGGR